MLGGALLGQQNYTDAEPLLLKGYEGLKAREATIPPQGKDRLPEALERLVIQAPDPMAAEADRLITMLAQQTLPRAATVDAGAAVRKG